MHEMNGQNWVFSIASGGNSDEDGDEKGGGRNPGGPKTVTLTKTRPKTKKPSMYKVLMMNDDYTPQEFVVHTLQQFFRMGLEDATRVMLQVHQKGIGVCGVFPFEIAEAKATSVIDFARKNQHPLQCTLEKE